ncbi:MAG: acylphosphatase [Candidatus Cloacimonetes bacterium]|nr:acylphosphatase [Candidatus Cloacimonadota bacterium]
MPTWEFYAHGRVQGVGYRWLVQKVAIQYEIHGYVRNLSDGSVFILAEAEEHVLESFQLAITTGSYAARVDKIEVHKLSSAKKYHDFKIK